MILHRTAIVMMPDSLEMELDLAVNKGWKIETILPRLKNGTTVGYVVVYSKGSLDE